MSDTKNACPPGWHLPSKKDLEELVTAAGGADVAGKTLKSASGWQDDDGECGNGDDSLGFSALPAGCWQTGSENPDDPEENDFFGIGERSTFWADSGLLTLYYFCDDVDIEPVDDDYANDFFSVRCIKDQLHYKVVRVLNGLASVASNDGVFFNVPVDELDFEPKVGDEVQCFRNGDRVIVLKNDTSKHSSEPAPQVQNVPVGELRKLVFEKRLGINQER